MPSKKITHVIFDYDGVLQDTETIYSIANDVTLKKFDRSFNNVLKTGMMGRRRDDAVQWILQQTGLADTITIEQYDELYEKTLDDLLPKAPTLPGAHKLVDYFTKINVPLAVCTGSDNHEFEQKSRDLKDFISKFQFIVLAGDDPEVKHGKPAPDPYFVTMERFATPPESPANVLVFEDSINGVRSALAAGCKTIFIPQEAFKTHDWEERIMDIKTQVAETLKSLEEFEPTKYGLPAF